MIHADLAPQTPHRRAVGCGWCEQAIHRVYRERHLDAAWRGEDRRFGEGIAILIVEQLARVALAVADYAAIMSHGRIRTAGEPSDVADALEGAYLGSVA